MSELWTPDCDHAGIGTHNLFNQLLRAQLQLNDISDDSDRHNLADEYLRYFTPKFDERLQGRSEATVRSNLAIIDPDRPDQMSKHIVENVGLIGSINDIEYFELGRITLGLCLNIDADYMFPDTSPDDSDMILRVVRAPISRVKSIEITA